MRAQITSNESSGKRSRRERTERKGTRDFKKLLGLFNRSHIRMHKIFDLLTIHIDQKVRSGKFPIEAGGLG